MSGILDNIAKLIRLLSEALSEEERTDVVIFGSAAIILHGVDLGRNVGDLDVFASYLTFEGISERYPAQSKPAMEGGDIPFIQPYADIEILKSFPGVEFDKVYDNSVKLELARGFKAGSLADLKAWKFAQGRPKDLADIEAIDRHVRLSGQPV
jgi:hypothetical protein